MSDPYSPLEKCRREFADDTAQKRAELYAAALRDRFAAALRDRFAAAALSGMHAKNNYHAGISTPQERARLAYIDADAMMEEREKRNQADMEARL